MGFGKDGKGVMIIENPTVALGALAAGTAILLTGGVTIQEDFRILRSDIMALIAGLTAGEGIGLLFGIANGELSATEIAQALLVEGPVDRNDAVSNERAGRNVKVLSALDLYGNPSATAGLLRGENGGPIIQSKHRWTYSDPEGWNFFVFNASAGTLTTGSVCDVNVKHFGVWVT